MKSLLSTILRGILTAIFYVIQVLLNIILLPITALINGLFPSIGNYFYYFENLFTTYLLPGIKFMREVFYNVTNINRDLMAILFVIPLTYLTFSIMNTSVRLIVSIYRIWKTGKDN